MTEQAHTAMDADRSDDIIAAIKEARFAGTPVYINGGGSKRHMVGRNCAARELQLAEHRGIVDYQPGELVITARAGTPLAELKEILAQQNQAMTFEPPLFGGRATLGGTLASNFSGPARPWCGSVRDAVLGVQLINGKGERLNYGGRVMKNVAGYDVSRLQAGALGTLGVLSQVSLKVLPLPEHSVTLRLTMTAQQALDTMNRYATQPKPLSGACWLDGQLYLRLSGAANAVEHTAQQWGGEKLPGDEPLWRDLREMSLPFFDGDAPLWRLSLGATTPLSPDLGAVLIDWGGAQRWYRSELPGDKFHDNARNGGGHACLLRGGNRDGEVRSGLCAVEQRLQQRLKQSFDPDGILNPGRLYSWL